MAKDLPYFKFFVSEWNDGDITLEDYETQGLFINICAYYWSNECNLTLTKLNKKFKHNQNIVNQLINEGLIKVENNDIVISFLIEQLSERGTLSNQNSLNAKKRWDNKRKESERNAIASISQCEEGTESMQYREEKRREEKKGQQFSKELIEFSEKFYNALEKYGDIKKRPATISKKNMNDLRLLNTVDGFSFEEITELAGFYFQVGRSRLEAPFVIQSLTSLRKKANSLQAAIRNHKE